MSKHKDFSHLRRGQYIRKIGDVVSFDNISLRHGIYYPIEVVGENKIIVPCDLGWSRICFGVSGWDIDNPLDYNPNNIKQKEKIMEQEYQEIELANLPETLKINGFTIQYHEHRNDFTAKRGNWEISHLNEYLSFRDYSYSDHDLIRVHYHMSFQVFLAALEVHIGKLERLPKEPVFDFHKYIDSDFFRVPFKWFHCTGSKFFRFDNPDGKIYLKNKHNADIMLKAQKLFNGLQLCK